MKAKQFKRANQRAKQQAYKGSKLKNKVAFNECLNRFY
jgi:hypothetical protein